MNLCVHNGSNYMCGQHLIYDKCDYHLETVVGSCSFSADGRCFHAQARLTSEVRCEADTEPVDDGVD